MCLSLFSSPAFCPVTGMGAQGWTRTIPIPCKQWTTKSLRRTLHLHLHLLPLAFGPLLAFLSCPFFLSFDRQDSRDKSCWRTFPVSLFLPFSPPFFFSRLPLEKWKGGRERRQQTKWKETLTVSLSVSNRFFLKKTYIRVIRQLSESLTRCTSGFAFKVHFSYCWRQCFQEVHLQTARTRNV